MRYGIRIMLFSLLRDIPAVNNFDLRARRPVMFGASYQTHHEEHHVTEYGEWAIRDKAKRRVCLKFPRGTDPEALIKGNLLPISSHRPKTAVGRAVSINKHSLRRRRSRSSFRAHWRFDGRESRSAVTKVKNPEVVLAKRN
jgi:hypothetical protein